MLHAKRNCKHAVEVWNSSPIKTKRLQNDESCNLEWFSKIFPALSKDLDLGMVIIWSIWSDRNTIIYSGDNRPALNTMDCSEILGRIPKCSNC